MPELITRLLDMLDVSWTVAHGILYVIINGVVWCFPIL